MVCLVNIRSSTQLWICCSGVWHAELHGCKVVWIPANLGRIWLLRLCELVKCFTGFRGAKILLEKPAGRWYRVSTDSVSTVFYMVVPIFLCFTTYLTKKGETCPERFWRNRCTCILRAMKQEEAWCKPVLYSIERRDKEDRTRSSHWMQTHLSSNSFSDSPKWLSTPSWVFPW